MQSKLTMTWTSLSICGFYNNLCYQIIKNDEGKAKGIAVVGFHSEEERQEAMKKHKCTMGMLRLTWCPLFDTLGIFLAP